MNATEPTNSATELGLRRYNLVWILFLFSFLSFRQVLLFFFFGRGEAVSFGSIRSMHHNVSGASCGTREIGLGGRKTLDF
jgi:hypothetical protein